MSEARRELSPNEQIDLVGEVNGRCPICNTQLMYEKGNLTGKNFQFAHIYPLNPTKDERKLLDGVPKLYKESANEKINFIPLCFTCHKKFDNPRTKEEYLKIYKKKLEIQNNNNIKNLLNNHKLEEEVSNLIKSLVQKSLNYNTSQLNYEPVTIDRKLRNPLLINKVRAMVQSYFLFIKRELESFNLRDSSFISITNTFKSAYNDISSKENDEQKIFSSLVDWLTNQIEIDNITANEVIISYFIQNCEVFDVISK